MKLKRFEVIMLILMLMICLTIIFFGPQSPQDDESINIEELHSIVMAQDSVINELTIAIKYIDEDLTKSVSNQSKICKGQVRLQEQLIKYIETH